MWQLTHQDIQKIALENSTTLSVPEKAIIYLDKLINGGEHIEFYRGFITAMALTLTMESDNPTPDYTRFINTTTYLMKLCITTYMEETKHERN